MTDALKKNLYDILDDISVGDVPFGVLKTFYEEDTHVLYDELIDMLSEKVVKSCDYALQKKGTKMFLYYLYKYRNTIKPVYKKIEDVECIDAAVCFDNHIRVSIVDLLQKKSLIRISIKTSLEGIMQKEIDYDNFSKELSELGNRYGLKVTSFNVPPMRHMNKYELEEENNNE